MNSEYTGTATINLSEFFSLFLFGIANGKDGRTMPDSSPLNMCIYYGRVVCFYNYNYYSSLVKNLLRNQTRVCVKWGSNIPIPKKKQILCQQDIQTFLFSSHNQIARIFWHFFFTQVVVGYIGLYY